ncbi:hypothetical protein TSUD_414270 [Trifolium subterraneum]|uniref:AP2/ERF domain-containing protein n=1 Tax=Trifolium subterraneum TaxID=3900 RepID=A0A2Z6P580_TRISU|nr:hypothetical protein TSUD_414270 [Trifolium subterraneum]
MEDQSREEYIGSLRRHHHNGRWEARIGRVFGNKYLYLGTYATQEEAATAYDMAAIEYRGLNAVTNFDLSRYIKWLKPNHHNNNTENNTKLINNSNPTICDTNQEEQGLNLFHTQNESFEREEKEKEAITSITQSRQGGGATSALGLLLQSSKFKEMMAAADDLSTTPQKSYTFPDDIQTYFESSDDHIHNSCSSSTKYGEEDIDLFNGFNSFVPSIFLHSHDFDLGFKHVYMETLIAISSSEKGKRKRRRN